MNNIQSFEVDEGDALFEAVGLGKTRQLLAFSDHIARKTGEKGLIVSPLAVVSQVIREGQKIGGVSVTHTRTPGDFYNSKTLINIVNYEMVEHFKDIDLGFLVLYESSILKNYTEKTKQILFSIAKNIPHYLF